MKTPDFISMHPVRLLLPLISMGWFLVTTFSPAAASGAEGSPPPVTVSPSGTADASPTTDLKQFYSDSEPESPTDKAKDALESVVKFVKGIYNTWLGFSWAAKLPLLFLACGILFKLFK